MNALATIALKEIRDSLRNRWVIAATLLLAALALALALLGSAPTGSVAASPLAVTVVSLSSLTIFLIPLIALLLAYDSLVGEFERGTMLLLLSCPPARWQIVLGKFAGHLAVLGFATIAGYGIAGLAAGLGSHDPAGRAAFGRLIGSTVLLGAVFLALGYLVSALVRERGLAAGLAVALWLGFVILYDMALLGALVADKNQAISPALFHGLLIANPADAFRMINLAGSGSAALMSGLAGLSAQAGFGTLALLGSLAGWVIAPLLAASLLFARTEL
jgi:Cu-processing system permease protein